MNKKISFIVPVYNVRDYVIRCLTSLVNQNISHSDFEIIVVIDGSPDNSLELVTEFKKKYSNIVVIVQENKGLSEARNEGLRLAVGEYVWFIDSDDWIAENCLSGLIDAMKKNDLEMFCVAPSIAAQSDFESFYNPNTSLSSVMSGKERLIEGKYCIGAWSYIFSSVFLRENSLQFFKGVYYEDEEFIPRALFFAKKVAMLSNFSVYFYFSRQESICNTISEKHVKDYLLVAESLKNFIWKNKLEGKLRDVFEWRISNLLLSGYSKRKLVIAYDNGKFLIDANAKGLLPVRIVGNDVKRKILLLTLNFKAFLAKRRIYKLF